MPGIKHHQIQKITHLEAPPNPQVVIKVSLADREPFKVRPDGVHLSLVEAHAALRNERFLCVVDLATTIPVAVVEQLMVVLDDVSME